MAGILRSAASLLLLASPLDAAAAGDARHAEVGDKVSLLQGSTSLNGLSEDAVGSGGHRSALQASEDAGAERRRLRTLNAVVDLDLPPEDRWYDFYATNRQYVLEHFEGSVAEAPESIAYFLNQSDPAARAELRKGVMENLDLEPHRDLMDEYKGIARALNDSRITPEAMLWLELGYERNTSWACTSLLATAADGEVFHGRNLDLKNGSLLTPYLVDVTYTRGGKPFAISTTVLLTVGAHTAYKIGAWSLSQNTRNGVQNQTANALAAKNGARPMAFFTRHLLEFAPDFKIAVQAAASSYLIAPQYLTIGGPNAYEGVVITRDREGRGAPYSNVMALSPQIDRWFIVQTNDDQNGRPYDKRRPTGLYLMQKLRQQDVDQTAILHIMMTEPVHNDGTVFTWVIQPRTGARRMILGGNASLSEVIPAPTEV